MALRITLKNGERVVVNGAVLRSTGRTDLCVESTAAILRAREIMAPEDATTPAKSLYFQTMMAYIDPDRLEGYKQGIVDVLQHVSQTLTSLQARTAILSFAGHVAGLQFYRALSDCRTLITIENDLNLVEAGTVAA